MKRAIKKVAVLGSGVMGSRIACHFAGIGLQVILLDIVPKDLPADAKPAQKNKIVNDALTAAIKSNPSPVYHKDVLKKITTGNFDDNMKDIAGCDWIIEVVVERLDIKKSVYEKVEQFRKPGTLITSNTSGIPIHMLSEGRSEDFKKNFCGTHFFNPPRYLRLLEIIPTPSTDPAVVDFLMHYGDLYLGKTTVLCKDTPAFIANRIGVYGIMAIFGLVDKMGLTIDEIDALTGPIIGRPKSATFRTADVVGIDTLVKVAKGVFDNCPTDEAKDSFNIPAWLNKLIENNWLGDKTGQGFFKKTKGTGGEKEILTLNLKTLEYGPRVKPKFGTLEAAKPIDIATARLSKMAIGTSSLLNFRQLVKDNTSFRMDEITGSYKDTSIHLDWQNAGYDRLSQTFTARSFSFRPALNKEEFRANQQYQADYMTLRTGAISAGPFDIYKYLSDTLLNAGTLTISDAVIEDFRDKRLPPQKGIIKPLPVHLLKKIPVRLDIDLIHVINAHVEYTELNDKTNQAGKIIVSKLNAKVLSASNHGQRAKDSLELNATFTLMDSIPIRLSLKESYTDSLAGFVMEATGGSTNARILNPLLIPLASVQLESGVADTLFMRVTGNEYLATGEMTLLYHDLKIKLLNNKVGSKKKGIKSFASFLANALVIKKSNRSGTDAVFFLRARDRSPLHYLVKIALSGISSSIGLKNNKKLIRQYKKEVQKRNL